MRLICPSCDAQYDIGDDVIPEGGRDVQCSSCAHTWFQDKETAAFEDDDTPLEAPERKPLDSSIADILKEEAEREKSLQQGGDAAEVDPESSDSELAEQTRQRIAQMAKDGDQFASPAEVAAASVGAVGGTQRSMPSIDEINATLRARAEASDRSGMNPIEQIEAVERRGFRRSFFTIILLVFIFVAPYVFAPQLIENLPSVGPYLTGYVETIDQGRLWLNEQAQNLMGMIPSDEAPAAETPVDEPAPTPPAETEQAPTDGN